MQPWEFEHRGLPSLAIREQNPIASKHYIFREDAMHFVVKDAEHPYIQDKPFDWMRGYQVGGRSLLWASDGRILILKGRFGMAMRRTGLFATQISHPGIATLRSLPVFPGIETDCLIYLMENFSRRMKCLVLKNILASKLLKTMAIVVI